MCRSFFGKKIKIKRIEDIFLRIIFIRKNIEKLNGEKKDFRKKVNYYQRIKNY